MGQQIECTICRVDFDNLSKLNEIIQDFANRNLRCEIKGNRIGGISKLIIEENYPNSGNRRIVVKAVISLYG